VPEVIAKPETFNISVDGLNDIVESLEIAEPEEDGDGLNKIECTKLEEPAATIFTFADVAPDDADATIGTQDMTPAEVDCNTEDPVAGEVAGKVYTVFPDEDETNAV
jgi:hypothetical protein